MFTINDHTVKITNKNGSMLPSPLLYFISKKYSNYET